MQKKKKEFDFNHTVEFHLAELSHPLAGRERARSCCNWPGKCPEQIYGWTMCAFTKEGDDHWGQWLSGNTCQAGLDFIFGCGGDRICSTERFRALR